MPTQSSRTVQIGLIFGAILGALNAVVFLISALTGDYRAVSTTVNGFTSWSVSNTGSLSSSITCLAFLGMLALTFVAGILSASRTGSVGSGSISGLIAGALGAVIGVVANLLTTLFITVPSVAIPANFVLTQDELTGILLAATAIASAFSVVLSLGLGAGLGALGGLIGANRYKQSHPPSLYVPGAALGYPPYPAYPPYPGYPGQPALPSQPIAPGQPWPPYPPYPSQPAMPYPPQQPPYPAAPAETPPSEGTPPAQQ